jgi:predicted dinucleotide-binding enzyme
VTTAVIGTGVLGSVIARQLASGGETLRLSSADKESARTLAAEIGRGAVAAVDNRDAVQGTDTVVLALRFTGNERISSPTGATGESRDSTRFGPH